MLEFRERLVEAMERSGVEQTQLADWVDSTQPTVSQWCRGETTPPTERIVQIAMHLDVEFSWLVAGKSSEEVQRQLKQLAKPVTWRFVLALASDWMIIVGAMLCAATWPTWWICMASVLVIGTRLHAIGILGHDAAHYLATRDRKVNDALGMVFCFWPLGGSLTGYRDFHKQHHRHLGTEYDPERHLFNTKEWKIPVKRASLVWQFIRACLGVQACLGIRSHDFAKLLSSFAPQTKTEFAGIPIWWTCFALTLWMLDCLWLLGLYAIAIPTVFWALIELRGWTEHRGIADTHRYQANWLLRQFLLPHNVWMHYEHHQWCYIPFYNLPRARELDIKTPVVQLKEVFKFFGTADPRNYADANGYQLNLDHFSGQDASKSLRHDPDGTHGAGR